MTDGERREHLPKQHPGHVRPDQVRRAKLIPDATLIADTPSPTSRPARPSSTPRPSRHSRARRRWSTTRPPRAPSSPLPDRSRCSSRRSTSASTPVSYADSDGMDETDMQSHLARCTPRSNRPAGPLSRWRTSRSARCRCTVEPTSRPRWAPLMVSYAAYHTFK